MYIKKGYKIFWPKNWRNSFRVSRDIPQKPAKRAYVDFLKNCICGDKNISDLYYAGG